jgi:hypothetical protein
VPRKIFGLKREEVQVAVENYVLRNFMINTKYYSGIKSKRMSLMQHNKYVGKNRNAFSILVGKPEGKRFTELAKSDVTRQMTQNDQQFGTYKPRILY